MCRSKAGITTREPSRSRSAAVSQCTGCTTRDSTATMSRQWNRREPMAPTTCSPSSETSTRERAVPSATMPKRRPSSSRIRAIAPRASSSISIPIPGERPCSREASSSTLTTEAISAPPSSTAATAARSAVSRVAVAGNRARTVPPAALFRPGERCSSESMRSTVELLRL